MRPARLTAATAATLCTGVLAVAVVASLFVGSNAAPAGDVVRAILSGPADGEAAHLVWDLRVPRTLLAATAGASLALAGAFAQSWMRNPLADPGYLGVTAGAAFAVAVVMSLGVLSHPWVISGAALAGSAAAVALITAVARRSLDPVTLILVGVGITAALQAGATMLALHTHSVFDGMRQWTVGTTAGRGWTHITIAAVGLLVGGVLAAVVARPLDLLSMGEESARALGVNPRWVHLGAAAVIAVLAGTATAAVGPVVFVGFAAPHITRLATGPSLNRMLAPVALVGALLVLTADILGRVVMRPGELDMSVVIAIVGAPLLIWVARRGAGALL